MRKSGPAVIARPLTPSAPAARHGRAADGYVVFVLVAVPSLPGEGRPDGSALASHPMNCGAWLLLRGRFSCLTHHDGILHRLGIVQPHPTLESAWCLGFGVGFGTTRS